MSVQDREAVKRLAAVRAVLFDLDGTLIDTVVLIRESMRHATRTVLGVEIADAELMRNVGIPLATLMRCFSEQHADALVAEYREHNATVHDELIAEYPGVEAVLAELRSRGMPMGVVTSKSRPVACRGIDLFGLGEFFDVLVCADDVEEHKPDPLPLIVAARRLGVEIEECAYVGDSPHDMTAALKAGAVAVAALWGAFEASEVLAPGPEFALREIGELISLLDGDGGEYFASATPVARR